MTKRRGEHARQALEEKKDQELEQIKNQAVFHAQPLPDLDHPFAPRPADHHPTQPEPFLLYTEVRAEERHQFDEQIKYQQILVEEMKVEQQREHEVRLSCCFSAFIDAFVGTRKGGSAKIA
jgi:hypothetical protein